MGMIRQNYCVYFLFKKDAARLNETPLMVSAGSSMTIPLLMKNKVPEGYETDDHLDVSLRPDEVGN